MLNWNSQNKDSLVSFEEFENYFEVRIIYIKVNL